MGFVYLIHLNEPFHHARHYIGYAERSVERRFQYHQQGQGACFLAAVNRAGIGYHICRIWEGVDREFERRLKNRKKSKHLCPVCHQRAQENPKVKYDLLIKRKSGGAAA